MTSSSKRQWQLIRESIKFQIKLALDAVRDLLLSPVAMICTVLDLIKGNSTQQGHFQRLMQWGHNTDHWLNLFGDLPEDVHPQPDRHGDNTADNKQILTQANLDENAISEDATAQKSRVDTNLDKLFCKIELILEDQQKSGLTATAKQKIAHYLAVLNSNPQDIAATKSSLTEPVTSTSYKTPKDDA